MQTLRPGATLYHGSYRIERVLGQGGFGITYLATDVNLGRQVAVKEFFPKDYCERDGNTSHVTLGTQHTAELVTRMKAKFIKEARNIAKFDHPGIIRIHAAFEENNTAYYVMEYIEGVSLSAMVTDRGPLSEEQALEYIDQVGDALGYVHSRQINHLDVKPANIMVRRSDNRAILIDFGLSKQYDTDGQQTSTTPTGLSHGFAPFEQYKAGGLNEFSPQSDLYSLAATLYYLMSGAVPPQAPQLVDEDLVFPSNIPYRLTLPIAKAMSSGRKKRQPTVAQFLKEIHEAATKTVNTEQSVKRGPSDNKEKVNETVKTVTTEPVTQQAGQPVRRTPTESPTVADVMSVVSDPPKKKRTRLILTLAAVVLVVGGIFVWKFIKAADYTPSGEINGHEYVDLGLPSGLKWATCNVGASTPSDYGNYYAWGETATKSEYTEENCKTYNKSESQLKSAGIINSAGNLTMNYDAARTNWGGSWRMPTKQEFEELINECQWEWISEGAHNGYRVTGPNGKSIFLTAAGLRDGTSLGYAGEYGGYWSTASYGYGIGDYAYPLGFNSYGPYVDRGSSPYYGRSVRAVAE